MQSMFSELDFGESWKNKLVKKKKNNVQNLFILKKLIKNKQYI